MRNVRVAHNARPTGDHAEERYITRNELRVFLGAGLQPAAEELQSRR